MSGSLCDAPPCADPRRTDWSPERADDVRAQEAVGGQAGAHERTCIGALDGPRCQAEDRRLKSVGRALLVVCSIAVVLVAPYIVFYLCTYPGDAIIELG